MGIPSVYQLRRFHVRVGRYFGVVMRWGLATAFASAFAAIPAVAMEAVTVARWLVFPATIAITAIFVSLGLYACLGALVVATSSRSYVERGFNVILLLGFGIFFAWAGAAGLYAFVLNPS